MPLAGCCDAHLIGFLSGEPCYLGSARHAFARDDSCVRSWAMCCTYAQGGSGLPEARVIALCCWLAVMLSQEMILVMPDRVWGGAEKHSTGERDRGSCTWKAFGM